MITSERVFVNATTYSLQDILSARVHSTHADLSSVKVISFGSMICVILALFNEYAIWFIWPIALIGLVSVFIMKRQCKATYCLIFTTDAGEVTALSSENLLHVSALATKINEAIVFSKNQP